jgi:TetR/AcrR family transcriptional regulator, transcriptional repressor for nem operon
LILNTNWYVFKSKPDVRPAMSTPETETAKPRTQPRALLTRTSLLDAALKVIRSKGYSATTVDDICAAAGVTKGSFFHHFANKEELAIESTRHWNDLTGGLFANAPYQRVQDPRERILAYIDFRAQIVQGDLADVTCLLGTMVQETFDSHPAIRTACQSGIESHARTLVPMIEQARALYAPDAEWSALSLAIYTQAALQGAFIMAKAQGNSESAAECITHLHRYVQTLFNGNPTTHQPTGETS